jgi:hypothetical protein
MLRGAMSKLTAIGIVFVALAAFAFSTSTRSADAAGPATFVSVSATAACGGAVNANAFVRDAQGLPFVGATVTFTSSTGGVGTGITNGAGIANATLTMPVAFAGGVTVTAQVAGGPAGTGFAAGNCYNPTPCVYGGAYGCTNPYPIVNQYPVVNPYPLVNPYNCGYQPLVVGYNNGCAYQQYPGYPYAPGYVNPSCYGTCYGGAPVNINPAANPGTLTCGGSSTISANITDAFGVPVANGTTVSLSTTLGTIAPTAATAGGSFSATLNTSAGVSGTAIVTIRAGTASKTTTLVVNCVTQSQPNVVVYNTGGGYLPPQGQPQVIYRPAPQGQGRPITHGPAGAPPFAPPRTGDAGLLNNIIPSDDAANAALIDSFEHQTDIVTDQSAVDSNQPADVDSNVDASMTNDVDSQPLDIDASLIDGNQLGDSDANASLALQSASQLDEMSSDFGLS